MKMRNVAKGLLLMSLMALTSCSEEEMPGSDSIVDVTPEVKLYTTTVGTYIKINNDDYDYSDSRGALLLKGVDGSTKLAADLVGSIHGDVTYELTDFDGNVYTRKEIVSSAFRTDVNGDFSTELLYDTRLGEAVSKIVAVNATLTVIDQDVAYEKDIVFSTETIWDAAMGFGSAIFEYDIIKHHSSYSDYRNELSQSFDINADIELVEAVNQTSSKSAVRASKVTKR